MSVLTYEQYDLACDRIVDGRMCQEIWVGPAEQSISSVRALAQFYGWTVSETEDGQHQQDFCPEHQEDA